MVAPRSGNPRLGFRHFVLRPDWAMDSKSYHKRLPLPRHLFSSANYLSLILPLCTGHCRPRRIRQLPNKFRKPCFCRTPAPTSTQRIFAHPGPVTVAYFEWRRSILAYDLYWCSEPETGCSCVSQVYAFADFSRSQLCTPHCGFHFTATYVKPDTASVSAPSEAATAIQSLLGSKLE